MTKRTKAEPVDDIESQQAQDQEADDADIENGDQGTDAAATSAGHAAKKPKTAASASKGPANAASGAPGSSATEADGSFTLHVAPMKRLSVSTFKGKKLIHIREYYKDKSDGIEKPGKKGITLSPEAWKIIVDNKAAIDAAIAKIK
ncbi:transcriptional Coactivator p15-domain-containing protein [Entophlyctis helioformis]|nr:transcriptional Coactivator p15-domain-containing protein [Entophlyctis helioformis]